MYYIEPKKLLLEILLRASDCITLRASDLLYNMLQFELHGLNSASNGVRIAFNISLEKSTLIKRSKELLGNDIIKYHVSQ